MKKGSVLFPTEYNCDNVACMMSGNNEGSPKNAKEALRNVLKERIKSTESEDKVLSENLAPSDAFLHIDRSDDDEMDDSDKKDEDAAGNSSIPVEERRIRNRLAARRCREKRKQRIVNLEKICNTLEDRIASLQNEVRGLEGQKQSLTKLLKNHICVVPSRGAEPIAVTSS